MYRKKKIATSYTIRLMRKKGISLIIRVEECKKLFFLATCVWKGLVVLEKKNTVKSAERNEQAIN